MPFESLPTLDLNLVYIFKAAAVIVAAIPLKPASDIGADYSTFVLPLL